MADFDRRMSGGSQRSAISFFISRSKQRHSFPSELDPSAARIS